MNVIKEMEALGKEIDSAKADVSNAEGKLSAYMEQLQRDHGIDSLEELQKRVEEGEQKQASLEAELTQELETLKKEYQW